MLHIVYSVAYSSARAPAWVHECVCVRELRIVLLPLDFVPYKYFDDDDDDDDDDDVDDDDDDRIQG